MRRTFDVSVPHKCTLPGRAQHDEIRGYQIFSRLSFRRRDRGCGHATGVPVRDLFAPMAGRARHHPLRLPCARPGGPAADLARADTALARHGLVRRGTEQIRTWNLSSLWRLSTSELEVRLAPAPVTVSRRTGLAEELAQAFPPGHAQ